MYQLSAFSYTLPSQYQPDPRYVVVRDGSTFERAIRELSDASVLTFDFETSGLAWYKHARACGIALACYYSNGYIQNYYVPFRHDTGEAQLDLGLIGPAIKTLLEGPALKVGHHVKFDAHIARREGWRVRGPFYDTMISSQFYDENRALALKARAVCDLGIADAGFWEDEVDKEIVRLARSQRLGKEAYLYRYGYSQIPVELCGIYACHDTDFTTKLRWFHEAQGVSRNYPRVWQTESLLVEVLEDMEWAGVPLDLPYLHQLRDRVLKMRDDLGKQISQWTQPYSLNVGSDDELRDYFMRVLRLPLSKLTKGKKLSVDREVLEEFKTHSPVIPLIMEWRDAEKIGSTYTNSLIDHADEHGFLHGSFKQVGTNTGRLSCEEPNLQQIPTDDNARSKAATGKELSAGGYDPWSVKRAFPIPNGQCRLYADYSQIELRMLAYYTQDPIMHEVYLNDGDIHERTCLEVFGKSGLNDDSIRRPAKVINFGLSYCLSAKGLSRQSKMPLADAEAFMDLFFQRYAGIARYRPYFWDLCRYQGNQFTNRFGRPRRVRNLGSFDKYERLRAERQAIGSLIQGTAAELTKESMVRLYRWVQETGAPVQFRMTVHDEIQADVDVGFAAEAVKAFHHYMEWYPEFAPIPIKVDIAESTTYWSEKKKKKQP